MRLEMSTDCTVGYKSGSQIARVVTELWVAQNLYCPACDAVNLAQAPANARAVDFLCTICTMRYQLKGGTRIGDRVPDAGYEAMIEAIRSDSVPSLLLMQYSPTWQVKDLTLVPSFFFTESAIEKRSPLGPQARRAGWVGCNILLRAIAPEGRVAVVSDSVPIDPAVVRANYKKLTPLAQLDVNIRGWALDVLRCVQAIGKEQFSLSEVYAYEGELSALHPQNLNVRAKIRQQLQILRDLGILNFTRRGRYELT
jgi:type II restriction enzyme